MSAEAALLGVPTFSCYPGEPVLIQRYLTKKKLLTRETDPDTLVSRILATLNNIDSEKKRQSARVQRLVRNFEDPIEIVTREVEKFG
jgi:predicted glycosyltransferase